MKYLGSSISLLIILLTSTVQISAQKNISDMQNEMFFDEQNCTGDSEFGSIVKMVKDYNGDSFDDFIVSAPMFSHNNGRCYMFFGGENYDTIPDLIFDAPVANGRFGTVVECIGDLNNDGFYEIIIAAPDYDSNRGILYLYFGGTEADNQPEFTLSGNNQQDFFGFSVAGLGDVNGDVYDDFIIGAYGVSSFKGAVYLYLGGATFNTVVDLTTLGETSNSFYGYSVSSAGDFNNDALNDFVVGAPNTGKSYIHWGKYGGPDGIGKLIITGTPSKFGFSVLGTGDLNNDDIDDVAISDIEANLTGEVYILFGNSTPDNVLDDTIQGLTADTFFGYSLSIGDVNFDNENDLVVSTIGNETSVGSVMIFNGGESFDSDYDYQINEENVGDNFGISVSASGDINADGISDLIIGANYFDSNKGKAYIFHGNETFDVIPEYEFSGENTDNMFGHSIDNVGDFNGDGYTDFAAAAYNYKNQTGQVYVYFGGQGADNIADWIYTGENENDSTGFIIKGIGDINNDNFSDFIVSVPGKNSGEGSALVFLGSLIPDNLPDLELVPSTISENFASAISYAGDFNNDSFDDFMIGAYAYPNGNCNGRVYIYFGSENPDAIADLFIDGEAVNKKIGYSVSSAGDFNNDGFDDIICGVSNLTSQGTAYIYLGGNNPNTQSDLILTGQIANDKFGEIVTSIGDINNDGFDDVAVSSTDYNFYGKVNIYFGGNPLNNQSDITITGSVYNSKFGKYVNGFGDINDDDIDDFAIYTPANDGILYVWFGKSNINSTHDVILENDRLTSNFGVSFSNVSNFMGGFSNDIIVGAENALANGEVYLFKGTLVPPVIENQSENISICEGSDIEFFVEVTATGTINYTWFISADDGSTYVEIENQNAETLFIENVPFSYNQNLYKCLAACEGGSIESIPVTLYVDEFIQSVAGENSESCETEYYQLSANSPTSGEGFWTCNNENIIFTNNTLYNSQISGFEFFDNVIFTWSITNGLCFSESNVEINFHQPVEITSEPENQTVNQGETAIFTTVGLGEVIGYQWQKNNVDISDGANISGSATSMLTISNSLLSDAGTYHLDIDGYCNDLVSSDAILNVLPVGVNEIYSDNFKVYPNPVKDILNVDFGNNVFSDNHENKLIIIDISGKKLYEIIIEKQNSVIDLQNFKSGIYILEIISGNKITSIQIVKE